MENIRQFVEDAVAGGCDEALQAITFLDTAARLGVVTHKVKALLLDPQAWQAVGKTRGWEERPGDAWEDPDWSRMWHRFIDQLANGKTIEKALAAIAN